MSYQRRKQNNTSIVPLLSTQHEKGNTVFFSQTAMYTMFEGLMEDWLKSQTGPIITVKTKQTKQ